jgi:hypothetical protein
MPFEAKIVCDSISPALIRLTTLELRYPRFIHAEVMTHRAFARNASSSRAIPVERLIQDALEEPALPIHWGQNQAGMQARGELDEAGRSIVQAAWLQARDAAVAQARIMAAQGAHKQLVNRILEPFTHIRVVITATEWANFFALRRHADAQPEIRHLADLMWVAMQTSQPVDLRPGEWHLPYVTANEALDVEHALKVSTARCARVSYRLHDGKPTTLEKDLALYETLVGADPKHASPAEHQATPDDQYLMGQWHRPALHGPFNGWVQHRKMLPNENISIYQEDK